MDTTKPNALGRISPPCGTEKAVWARIAATVFLLLPAAAMADSLSGSAGSQFFCYIAQYFKYIVGTAALVAIFFWAIEHVFGVSRIHDIVIRVGVACAFVIAGATLITNSGLTVNCVLA